MRRRMTCLALAVVTALLAAAAPARAGTYRAGGAAGLPMSVTCSCPDEPIRIGSEVTVTVTCEGAASLAVQVVQPDSSQRFYDGGTVVFTPAMAGTHAVKAYGLDAAGEYVALSERVDFAVEALPPASDVYLLMPDAHAAVERWRARVSLFSTARDDVYERQSDKFVRGVEALYTAASDTVGTAVRLVVKDVTDYDSEEAQIVLMKNLLLRNLSDFMSERKLTSDYQAVYNWAEEWFSTSADRYKEVKGWAEFIIAGLQSARHRLILEPMLKETGDALNGIKIWIDGAAITVDSLSALGSLLCMMEYADTAYGYLDCMTAYAHESSALYKAAQRLRDEIGEDNPLMSLVRAAYDHRGEIAGILGEVISDATTGQLAIRVFADMEAKRYVVNYIGSNMFPLTTPEMAFRGTMMGVLWGQLIGRVLTAHVGRHIALEEEVLRLDIAGLETEYAMDRAWKAGDEQNYLYLAGLYTLVELNGAKEAAEYYINYGESYWVRFWNWTQGVDYPSREEIRDALAYQRNSVNSIRTAIGRDALTLDWPEELLTPPAVP